MSAPDSPVAPAAAVPPSTPPTISAGKRLLLSFTSPVSVFQDIARSPSIAAVFVALMMLAFMAQACLVPKLDMSSVVARMSKAGMDDAAQAKAMQMVNTFKWVGVATTPIQLGMWLAILTGLYFLALKLLGSDQTDFLRVFSGVAHAAFPAGTVRAVLTCLVSFTRSSIDPMEAGHLVKSNVAAFLPAGTSQPLMALGESIDIFAFWNVALIALALSIIGRISKTQAATLAIVFWFLGTVLKVGLAAIGALAGK